MSVEVSSVPAPTIETTVANGVMTNLKQVLVGTFPVRQVILDGQLMISGIDLVKAISGKHNDEGYASVTLGRIVKQFGDCLENYVRYAKFEGRAYTTPFLTLKGMLKATFYMPGKLPQKITDEVIHVYTRLAAGDETLHAEIERNSKSSGALNVMARETLAAEKVQESVKRKVETLDEEDTATMAVVPGKKSRTGEEGGWEGSMELVMKAIQEGLSKARKDEDMERLTQEMEGMKLELTRYSQDLAVEKHKNETMTEKEKALCAEIEDFKKKDETSQNEIVRLKMELDKARGSSVTVRSVILMCFPDEPYDSEDNQKIGVKLKAAYIAQYGFPPPCESNGGKYDKPCNQYYTKDLLLMKKVVRQYFKEKRGGNQSQ